MWCWQHCLLLLPWRGVLWWAVVWSASVWWWGSDTYLGSVIGNETCHWLRENVCLAHHRDGNYQTRTRRVCHNQYVLHRTRVSAVQVCLCARVRIRLCVYNVPAVPVVHRPLFRRRHKSYLGEGVNGVHKFRDGRKTRRHQQRLPDSSLSGPQPAAAASPHTFSLKL